MSYFAVMTSAAQTKGLARKFGRYKNVAVVEVEDGHEMPRMISTRSRGLVRIVKHWGSCNVGKAGGNSQYAIALREAQELVEQLALDGRQVETQHTAYGTHTQEACEPGDREPCQILGSGVGHRDDGRGRCIDCGAFL